MSGSYRQCPECGKRALSIATRCPGCCRELPAFEATEPGPGLAPRRLRQLGVAAGVIATAVVVALATVGRTGHVAAGPSSFTTVKDSTSGLAEVAYAAPAPRPATASAGGTSVEGPRLLVARTWTSVRQARSRNAMLEAVLLPGDTVLADSLGHGWYRVALEGAVLGYAHRSTLVPPGIPIDSLH